MNYYNEFDPHAAAWLRELIKAGLIPAGDVDERSIEDVRPVDIAGYVQCHFFAGIGGWAYALDLAGWPRDRPVWTGSCPCQPFSAAGKGAGFEDERHLWPAWNHLIAQCRPAVVFGEQVASKGADAWIDLVHADLEGLGYAFGCVPFPAAGIGAPHIRDRNYWVANASGEGLQECERIAGVSVRTPGADARQAAERIGVRAAIGLADSSGSRSPEQWRGWQQPARHPESGELGRLGHANSDGAGRIGGAIRGTEAGEGGRRCSDDARASSSVDRPGPGNGHWRAADWLGCRDGKWRPVEPGTFPLAHGLPARVGRLRGYGNAIVPQAAAEFVKAMMEAA